MLKTFFLFSILSIGLLGCGPITNTETQAVADKFKTADVKIFDNSKPYIFIVRDS